MMSAKSTTLAAELVAFDTAQRIVSTAVNALGSEYVSLSAVSGRVAAENVIAEEDLVPYARSAMDGYALRASDTTAASPSLRSGFQSWGNLRR